jgi:metaxin
LFDASVFAYTHLLLDESLNWQNTRLVDSLKKSGNLVQHRQR